MGVVDMILASPPPLSPRQCEILQAAADGEHRKVTAARLHVTMETVKWHRKNIVATLAARSLEQAVAIGMRQGLIR
jgi:DNA-binding NarL/FixJ family response regulator